MHPLLSNLTAWQVFESVARTGSLSRAAIELDLSVSKASRLLARLEQAYGEDLICRAARPLAPTPAGGEVLAALRKALPAWRDFEVFLGTTKSMRHVVRLSTPVGIGRFYLNAQLAEYRAIAPHVVIEASIEKGVEELLRRDIDVAFLPYTPSREDLVICPAMHAFTMPLACPAYLRRHGTPHAPQELRRHDLILKTGEHFPVATHLVLRGERRPVVWRHVVFHHDMLNIKDAVLRGFGIGLDIPLGMVLDELRSGLLVPVLDGWHRDYWDYCIAVRRESGPQTVAGAFAAWYAHRATQEIDARRREGFRILGIEPETL